MARSAVSGRVAVSNRKSIRDFGTCLYYSSDSCTTVLASTIALSGVFTLYVWFNRHDNNPNWIIGSSGNAKIGFFQGTNNINLGVRLIDGGGFASADIGYTTDKNNTWNFVCLTRDASNVVAASLNGNAFVTIGTYGVTTTLSKIGHDNATDGFQGLLDEIVFTNANASLTDAKNAYYSGVYAGTKLLWYKFDEGSGTSATDSSGNGNTGTITAATYSTNVFMKPRTATSGRVLA